MAEFRIVVVVDPKGAVRGTRQVERQLTRTGQAADRTRALIARAFAFVGVAAGVRQITAYVDAFQNMNNRLRTVTTNQGQLNASLVALEGVARRTRTSLDGIVTLYQRGAIAANQLGITNERLVGFVEKVGQALAIQGASAATTRGALLQLSQALGSSIVRAEEFNSILEGAFPIAQAAAQGIDRAGGSVARLRQLILNGEVTSRQFFEGFEKGAVNLDEVFKRTVPTISQAFVVLRDSVTLFLGRLDKARGVSASFARGVLEFSSNLETAARVAGAVAIVIGTVLVRALARAAAGLVALSLSNPFTAILFAATSAVALLITFSDTLKVPGAELANLQDTAKATFEVVGAEAKGAFSFVSSAAQQAVAFVQSNLGDLGITFSDLTKVARAQVNRIIGLYVGLGRAFGVIFKGIGSVLESVVGSKFGQRVVKVIGSVVDFGARALTFITGIAQKAFGAIGKAADGLSKRLGDEFESNDSVIGSALEFGNEVKVAFLSGLNQDFVGDLIKLASPAGEFIDNVADRIKKRAEELARDRIAQEKLAAAAAGGGLGGVPNVIRDVADPAVVKFLDNLRIENDLLRLNTSEREIRSQIIALETDLKRELGVEELAEVETLLKLNQALGQQAEILDEIREPQQTYADGIDAVNALLALNAISTGEAAAAVRDLKIAFLETQTGIFDGFERGFLKAQKNVEDFSAASEKLISDAFREAQDVLVGFFRTGKFEAEDFFRSIGDNLLQLAAQQALAAAFGQAGSGGGFSQGGGTASGAAQGIGGLIAQGVSSYFSSGGDGFQNGGSFTVGAGTAQARIPGIDNRLVAFRAQDGEKVTVTPKNENGAGQGVVNQVFNIETPDADSFHRSQTQLQNRANAGLSRARARR